MLSRLIRTLVEDPHTGGLVRHIRLGDWQTGKPNAHEDLSLNPPSEKTPQDTAQCAPAVASCPDKYKSDFCRGLISTSQDAMTAAILFMLSNLEVLRIPMVHMTWRDNHLSDSSVEYTRTLTFRAIELAGIPVLAEDSTFKNLNRVELCGGINFYVSQQG